MAPAPDTKRKHAIGAMLALGASGCILLVDPPQYKTHCSFAAAKTPCGECLTANCITELDPCCQDDTCGGVIADVESCATKHDAHCVPLQSPTDESGAHAALSTCVATHCKDVCAESVTDCGPAFATSVNACTCQSDSTPNTTACTTVGHPTLRCCAPDGWPEPAYQCQCLAVICVGIAGECMCELNSMDDQQRATECRGGPGLHCCADQSGSCCSCSSSVCLPSDTEVSNCKIDQLKCGNGTHQVEACSVQHP